MPKTKRRHSDSGDDSRKAKVAKVADPERPMHPPDDCFEVELKLRSTSKAERNDPKPPEYYRKLFRPESSQHRPESTGQINAALDPLAGTQNSGTLSRRESLPS